MQLQRIVVAYNPFDFPSDGIPARTYGGQIQLVSGDGTIAFQLDPNIVVQVLDLVADDVAKQARALVETITPASIRANVALEHRKVEVNQTHKNALRYILNTNGGATKDIFIEDHEPVGTLLWDQLENLGYVAINTQGKIRITSSAYAAMELENENG